MAHGKNASKQKGKDWWGKRPLAGKGVSNNGMKWWKRYLHKIERAEGKKQIDFDYELEHNNY